jgi:hypothetical protein
MYVCRDYVDQDIQPYIQKSAAEIEQGLVGGSSIVTLVGSLPSAAEDVAPVVEGAAPAGEEETAPQGEASAQAAELVNMSSFLSPVGEDAAPLVDAEPLPDRMKTDADILAEREAKALASAPAAAEAALEQAQSETFHLML